MWTVIKEVTIKVNVNLTIPIILKVSVTISTFVPYLYLYLYLNMYCNYKATGSKCVPNPITLILPVIVPIPFLGTSQPVTTKASY